MNFTIRYAKISDIDRIKIIADKNKKYIGFIIKGALVDSINFDRLLIEDCSGSFCHFRKRRDGVTVIYEICVPQEFNGMGIGRMLINALSTPIQLKCPVDNVSNGFYEHIGFCLIGKEQGKKRELNVWRLG